MTSINAPGDGLPDNLPLLTEVADEPLPDDLPTLTEIVSEGEAEPAAGLRGADQEAPSPEAVIPASCAPEDEEMQRLLRRIEPHLEVVFAQRLSLSLERLQRQAIEQAVKDLKAELPGLLRDALKAHPGL